MFCEKVVSLPSMHTFYWIEEVVSQPSILSSEVSKLSVNEVYVLLKRGSGQSMKYMFYQSGEVVFAQ